MSRRLGLVACLLLPSLAAAHGVNTTVTSGPAVVVTVTFEDGTPMADVTWTVTAPDNAAPRRTGRTDAAGRVVFLPEVAGPWEVRISGADGHGVTTTVTVTEDMVVAPASGGSRGPLTRLVIGVIVLFLVFGLASRFLVRRA